MILPRASVRWTGRLSQRSSKASLGPTCRHTQKVAQKRGYATASGEGGHSTHKSSSDLPWAIGSLVVTVPSVFYLIQPQLQPKKSHGHDHGGDGHPGAHNDEHNDEHDDEEEQEKDEGGEEVGSSEVKEEGGDGSDDQAAEEGAADGSGSAGDEVVGKKDDGAESDDSASKAPSTPGDKGPDPEAHVREGGGNVEGVRFKGATSGGTKEGEQGDTRKHIPDAKGGSKKRIESDYGKRQGEATEPEQDPDDKDLGAASKATGKAGSSTTQSSKQEGLSNTDTKHSTDIKNDPEKATKSGGMPETAKVKGTVDPNRPQV